MYNFSSTSSPYKYSRSWHDYRYPIFPSDFHTPHSFTFLDYSCVMDLWSPPDHTLYQQSHDPFVNQLFALRDGFGSSDHYMPSTGSPYFFPPVQAPKGKSQRRNTIINTPDHTQRRPITRVPAEVWVQILKRCIPSREEDSRIPTLSPRNAPMQLTAVTKGLRQVALTTPELWTSISLVPDRDRELPCIDTIDYWLRLSQDRPLTISVSRNKYGGVGEDLEYLFWKLAKRSGKRWAHLYVNPGGIYGKDGRWSRYTFPRLKSVTIQGGIPPARLPECFKSFIKQSESLASLAWTDVEPVEFERRSEFLLNVSLPLSRLQSLKLSNPLWPSDALNMLKHAPMLQDLELTALKGIRYAAVIMGTYPTQPIQLLRLRSLSVNALKFEEERGKAVRTSMDDFLPYIFTPNLQTLSIGYNDDQRTPFTALQSFLTSTRCRLASLTFSYTPLSAQELHSILTYFTSLGSLRALTVKVAPQFPSPLSDQLIAWMLPSPQCLVPTLQTFSFNPTALNASTPGAFANMLNQRCRVRPRFLRSVHFEELRAIESRSYAPNEILSIREFAPRYRLITTSN